MTLSLDLVQAIEQVVASRLPGLLTATGTVVTRSKTLTDPWLTVTFDGSATPVPARAFGSVYARPGDRVGLVRYGPHWVVAGSYTPYIFEDQGLLIGATAGNTISASPGFTPGGESFTFSKDWDDTRVRMRIITSCYATNAAAAVKFGLSFVGLANYDVATLFFNQLNQHLAVVGENPGETGIPAGDYEVALYWYRDTGTGTLNQDSGDWVSISATEIGP